MNLKLISHVNADSDLIEAWLKYYLRLGIDSFHLVVHGPADENEKLFSIKDSYPITIEDTYGGPFLGHAKKTRLDSVLARHTGQWIVLVDSDEFVEFPYGDIPATIRVLESAHANLLAAPMLQRLTIDGSLETPPVIEEPFKTFPLCSAELYRRMGVKGDIFKFPLFFCAVGTQIEEEGNHHPPLGLEPKSTGMLGVTHHFKFRRTASKRLDQRINSEYEFRQESVQYREYLENHANRLPLEGAFSYSREELFRRRLLRELPLPKPCCEKSRVPIEESPPEIALPASQSEVSTAALKDGTSQAQTTAVGKKILFVLPKSPEFGGLEKHFLDLLARLREPSLSVSITCFEQDIVSVHMDPTQRTRVAVKCTSEPQSLMEWVAMIRAANPDTIIFCYSWLESFPWQAQVAALLAGVSKRYSIQHLIPLPPKPPVVGNSPANLLRRFIGKRTRHLLGIKVAGNTPTTTICVSNAVRDALVNSYGFPAKRTITVRNGVSTSHFSPSKTNAGGVRARFDIEPGEFLLVCAARLVEAKGVDILLHAVSRVVRQGVTCKCIILGDGVLKESLMRLANSLGLSGHVFFEGFQNDVRPYLHAGSAFILTSHLEGLPLSVLEAMASGLPCIVTNVGGTAEVVKNGVTGLVIPPGSVDEAENAILYLATHPEELANMASKTRETVRQSFAIDDRMGELKELLLG